MRHTAMVLVITSCLSVFACAQTAEELVSKNIQAKGGLEKMKAPGPGLRWARSRALAGAEPRFRPSANEHAPGFGPAKRLHTRYDRGGGV